MSAQTIRNALGLLQDDSENDQAWTALESELSGSAMDVGMASDELAKLLASARRAHEARREFEAVRKLLSLELKFAAGTPDEAELVAESARVLDEELLHDVPAMEAYRRLLELRPGDSRAEEAIEKSDAKRARWLELVARYEDEAKATTEGAFRSSLLVSAAEVAYRYGIAALSATPDAVETLKAETVARLRVALENDPRNRRAELLLERMLLEAGKFDELASALDVFASNAASKEESVIVLCRLARIHLRKQKDWERAVTAYARVIDLHPGHHEATSALVDQFTEHQRWDELATLYEEQLASGAVRGSDEAGALFQAAMVHWKMRNRPDAAEPHFDRLRKLDPSHQGVLNFYREWCTGRGETAQLAAILTEAQRVLPEGPARAEVSTELAKLAEEGSNAQRAIEQWRALLRQDPKNHEARDGLRRLYRQTSAWAQLTELLRGDIERVGADDAETKLAALREIAVIYRDHLKNDAARATVLSQIVAQDPTDLPTLRELGQAYEALQRWRDLLLVQAKQAELEKNPASKAELYRAIARRWLEQFSNVQNAVEAYEKLNLVDPSDDEANTKLHELYTKRRAFRPLYELIDRQVAGMPAGPARREKWAEMARLSAERLDKGRDAIRLYKLILDEEPSSIPVMDALEKQAEREKDFETVADVLEHRVVASDSEGTQLAALQKLGAIYSDRLSDLPKAIKTWRRVLVLSPGQAKAMRIVRDGLLALGDFDGLTELYSGHGEWESLAEVLSAAAEKATDDATRVELSFRAAEVYTDRLHTKDRAAKAYERVLSVRPTDKKAATLLAEYSESEQKWARLPPLYEVLLGHAESTDEKVALLEKLAAVASTHLQDPAGAFGYVRRAYDLAPHNLDALRALEQAARAAGQWEQFVVVLASRLASGDANPAEVRALRSRIAHVYGAELDRIDEAVLLSKQLLEEDFRDEGLIRELDGLLKRANRRDDLRWLYNHRIAQVNTAQKLDLLSEWAAIEEDVFGEPKEAAAIQERVLEIVGHHGSALRALARLRLSLGDPEGALSALERDRDQREGGERAQREVEIAKIHAERGRSRDALAAAERALALVDSFEPALVVIEALLHVPETRARSAEVLNDVYGRSGRWARKAEMLAVRLSVETSRESRIAIIEELVLVHDTRLSDPNAAFDVLVRSVAEYPDVLPLWDRLFDLATKTDRLPALSEALALAIKTDGAPELPASIDRDLSERTAVLLEDRLGDIDRARFYWERVLGHEPTNEAVFARLKHVLTMREQWDALEATYERAIAATTSEDKRVELLSEIALVAEDITSDRAKATAYYERILALDPANARANSSLDALYQAAGQWDRLAALLERSLARDEHHSDAVAMHLRLGSIYTSRLGEPSAAMAHVDSALRQEPTNRDALEQAEGLLLSPSQRRRAAELLEWTFGVQADAPNLARAIAIRLEDEPDKEVRKGLLHRLADIREAELHDAAGALAALEPLVALDPTDRSVRTRLVELSKRCGASARATAALETAATHATDPAVRAEILVEAAVLAEDALPNHEDAERLYTAARATAGEDASVALPICRALERIYAATNRPQKLCAVLRDELRFETDFETVQDLRARVADLLETAEDNIPEAINFWRARLDADPNDLLSQASLARLYERMGRFEELVWVVRLRQNTATDPAFRKAQKLFAATILADKLTNVELAIAEYQSVVDEFGPDRATLANLQVLFEISDRYEELAASILAELGLADDPASKVALLLRLASVRRTRLRDIEGAIDAYRQALAFDPADRSIRGELESFLGDPAAEAEAAAILQPLYEADGEKGKLLRTIDIEIAHTASPRDKLLPLERAVQIAEESLSDQDRAFGYAAKGVEWAAGDPDVRRWVDLARRLASSPSAEDTLIALLRSVLGQITYEDEVVYVALLLAELLRGRPADWVLAKGYYEQALTVRPANADALLSLQSLLEEHREWPGVVDVLRRRVEIAESDADKRTLLIRIAELTEEKLSDSEAALAVYEQVIEEEFAAPIVAQVDRLYRTHKRWAPLVQLLERKLAQPDVSVDERALYLYELGQVSANEQDDVERALDAYGEALSLVPEHPAVVGALEALLAASRAVKRVAEMLERVYIARFDFRRVIALIEARLPWAEDAREKFDLLERLAKLEEEQEENYPAALATYAKLLSMDSSDERIWGELERLAKVGGQDGQLAQIFGAEVEKLDALDGVTVRLCERAAFLLAQAGENERALSLYRRAFDFDPSPAGAAFGAIDELLAKLGRSEERIRHFQRALELTSEPSARALFLHAKADIEESLTRNLGAAISTWQEAFELDDHDPKALAALTRLLEAEERWQDLADLYRRKAEASESTGEQVRWRLALARHLIAHTKNPTLAAAEYEAVLELLGSTSSPDADAALAELEGMLARGEEQARVLDILSPVYESRDDFKSVIRLSNVRAAVASDPAEKIAAWKRAADLTDSRLGDASLAFDTLKHAYWLDPADFDLRERLERFAEATGRWNDLVTVLEKALLTADPVTQRSIWSSIASIHDKRRDDPRRALDAWGALQRLDETDVAPLDEMDALATLLSDWATLARVLEKKAELSVGDDMIATTYRRLGETKRDMLDDATGALHAYERAFEVDSTDAYTLDCVIELSERAPDAKRLVELYQRRVELCTPDENEKQFALLTAAADQAANGLNDRREAIVFLSRARELSSGDQGVLERLDALFTAEEMWSDLLDVLRQKASLAEDANIRFDVEKRIGLLLAQRLNEPGEAVAVLSRCITERVDDAAITELRAIGDKFDELRADVATVLEDVLRRASRFSELVEVFELRLRADSDPSQRAGTLLQMADVLESALGLHAEARSALLRALKETSDNPIIHSRIEAACAAAGGSSWGEYADALAALAAGSFDSVISSDLFRRLGVIAEDHLGDLARAASAYKESAERNGDSESLLRSLDRVLAKLGDDSALADVLERRIVIEENASEQADLYYRLGLLQLKQPESRDRGLASLRAALERVSRHEKTRAALVQLLADRELFTEAFDALESVYRAGGESESLADLYARRIELTQNPGERLSLRQELVRIYEDGVRDIARAQKVAEDALREAASDEDVLAEVRRIAGLTGNWASATSVLGEIVEHGDGLSPATRATLYHTLSAWRRDHTGEAILAEKAIESAIALEPENLEFFRELERMQRGPGRELDLTGTLCRIARIEQSTDDKRSLLHEAATIAESVLHDARLEESIIREILAEDESDAWAVERLVRLREAASDPLELVTLLLRLAELSGDGAAALALKHRAADTLVSKAKDAARAIGLYEEILDFEPEDQKAVVALRHLYAAEGRFKDLAHLLRRLVDVATSVDERAALRFELATLEETKLKSEEDAIDLLRAVLDEVPSHTDALLALSRLYESAGRDADMADLLRVRIESADASGDAAGAIKLLLRLADLQERRLDDLSSAEESLERIVSIDPQRREAFESLARIAIATGDVTRGIQVLFQLIELLPPSEASACAIRIADLADKISDDEGLEKALLRGLSLKSDDPAIRERLQHLYEKESRYSELAQLVVGDADLALASGNGAVVVSLLRRAAKIHLENLHDPSSALSLFERASALAPNDRDLLLLLCDTYAAADRHRDAAACLEKVIASFGGKRSKEVSVYYHRLGGVLRSAGDLPGALLQFDQAFKIDPGSVSVLRDLGMLAFETGDLDRAQKTFRALLLQRLDPGSGTTKNEVFYYLGEISLRLGDKPKAQQMFERAIENDGSDTRSRARLEELRR